MRCGSRSSLRAVLYDGAVALRVVGDVRDIERARAIMARARSGAGSSATSRHQPFAHVEPRTVQRVGHILWHRSGEEHLRCFCNARGQVRASGGIEFSEDIVEEIGRAHV